MDFEVIAGFFSFVALIVVWAVAPKTPAYEGEAAKAPALQPKVMA